MILALVCISCTTGIYTPELPQREGLEIPSGVDLEPERLFGVWEGKTGNPQADDSGFIQSYRMEFQSVDDSEAVLSHWFTDADSEVADSLKNVEYEYSFDGKVVTLTPKPLFASAGASAMSGIYLGSNRMLLCTSNHEYADTVCTLVRVGDPVPAVTGVDRTLPQPGDTVTITGRNLQFVDHVFLPGKYGEIEVTDVIPGSRSMKIVVPDAEFAGGSLRCYSSTAGESSLSPAYMFRHDCIFFHNFISDGYKAPYTGSEFEYSIKDMGGLKSNVKNLSTDNLPASHSLTVSGALNHPDSLLSFFGEAPVDWPLATKTDDKKGYLRFSTADRFQHVLDNCAGGLTAMTPCADAAIQMDIYVMSDGRPEWSTGYLSWRLNKDQNSLESSMLANVAMWEKGVPTSFAGGWKTLTIPLATFSAVTSNVAMSTLGGLISSLKSSNLQTILTLVNFPLDDMHPAQELDMFQFSIADVRLVPYKTPSNVKDNK